MQRLDTRSRQTLPCRLADVIHADRRHRLDAWVDFRSRQAKAAAAADADDADAGPVDQRVQAEVVHRGAEVLDEGLRRRDEVRLAAALSVVGSVKGEGDKASFCHRLSVEPRRLFLHATERVSDDDGRVALRPVQVLGDVQIRDQLDAQSVSRRTPSRGSPERFAEMSCPTPAVSCARSFEVSFAMPGADGAPCAGGDACWHAISPSAAAVVASIVLAVSFLFLMVTTTWARARQPGRDRLMDGPLSRAGQRRRPPHRFFFADAICFPVSSRTVSTNSRSGAELWARLG